MARRHRTGLKIGLITAGLVAVAYGVTHGRTFAVLQPAGVISAQERSLMLITVLLSVVVVVPVFALLAMIIWKYRASNAHAHYAPDWEGSKRLELIWWLIPLAIIAILSVITWRSTHALDPYRPITSDQKPLTIQVVALDWKWLFIYPDQQIASVNQVYLPNATPVNFVITADAPMNSFWIPQLAGQIYAMPGMTSQLHVMATKTGTFNGSSANLSGEGFAGMRFTATSATEADFTTWVKTVKQADHTLDSVSYDLLAQPSKNVPPTYYSTVQTGLYDTIMHKYMGAE